MSTLGRDFAAEAGQSRDDHEASHREWWVRWYGPVFGGDYAEIREALMLAGPRRAHESWPMVLERGRAVRRSLVG